MMTSPAAIQGTFADLKTVKTRSVVQLIIEVPIEQGKQVVDAFGFPQPGSEIPVAVARMNPSQSKPSQASTSQRKPAATRAEKARRMCGVAAFQDWMRSRLATQGTSEECWARTTKSERYSMTSEWVKIDCGVQTKTALNPVSTVPSDRYAPTIKWDQLLAEYELSVGRMAERTR